MMNINFKRISNLLIIITIIGLIIMIVLIIKLPAKGREIKPKVDNIEYYKVIQVGDKHFVATMYKGQIRTSVPLVPYCNCNCK